MTRDEALELTRAGLVSALESVKATLDAASQQEAIEVHPWMLLELAIAFARLASAATDFHAAQGTDVGSTGIDLGHAIERLTDAQGWWD